MENYFDTYNKNNCNGCGTCALRCPKKAITMQEDEEGFLYPVIDKNKCINCGLCRKICSNNPLKTNDEDVYIAINKDKKILNDSSSGGMFTIIANYVLEKNGVVFGAIYDKEINVIHNYVDSFEDLSLIRHSKYVRSNIGNCYLKVEELLKNDKMVLFTGTPCQCAGLRAYLMKEYENLLTCDIICHANASPKVFNMFKQNISKKYNSKIKKIDFRNKKKYGWHSGNHMDVELVDGKVFDIPEYTKAFQHELINRPSCHNCRFCTEKRYSDFTIGDLWGIEKVSQIKDDNTGISLLSVNTEKGKLIFEQLNKSMYFEKIDNDLAFKYNHNSNVPYHKNRNKFFKKIANGSINEDNIIKYLNVYVNGRLYKRILRKIKKFFDI